MRWTVPLVPHRIDKAKGDLSIMRKNQPMTLNALASHLENPWVCEKTYGFSICHQVPPQITGTATNASTTGTQNTNINQNTTGTQNQRSTSTGQTQSTGSQQGTSAQQGTSSGQQAQQNTYTGAQQALQGQALGQAGQFLQTGIAPGVQQEIAAENAAFNQNFQTDIAPGLAAQYGAGSPIIAGQEAEGLVNLISNVYQNQAGQFNAALGTAGGLAFNPTGTTGTESAQQASNAQNQSTNQQNTNTSNQSNTTSNWQEAMSEAQNMASASNSFGLGVSGTL